MESAVRSGAEYRFGRRLLRVPRPRLVDDGVPALKHEGHVFRSSIPSRADLQNYGTAGEQATNLSDDIALMSERTEDNEKVHAALQQVLAARDEVISGLATAQPASAQRVKQLYLDLFDTAY